MCQTHEPVVLISKSFGFNPLGCRLCSICRGGRFDVQRLPRQIRNPQRDWLRAWVEAVDLLGRGAGRLTIERDLLRETLCNEGAADFGDRAALQVGRERQD